MKFEDLKNKFFVMAGPNVIESEEHTLMMARALKDIFAKYDVNFIFKVSFDKANRTSASSYRGLGFEEGLAVLRKIKEEVGVPIITDIHESWQVKPVSKIVDVIQVPAFLCRQTDLLKAVAETDVIIHVKKGQFCSADVMHKSKEKLIQFGNPNVILCERGNFFGYQDLVVDPRNLIWLRSDTNLVSMDITHCLQAPAQKMADGTIKAGGYRDLIPHMGKMAIALGVNGIFMEVHDRPDQSLCDAPTQWYLEKLEWLLDFIGVPQKTGYNTVYQSTSNSETGLATLGTIERDMSGFNGRFSPENLRGERVLNRLLEFNFDTVLDIGAGQLEHSRVFSDAGKTVDAVDYGDSVYYRERANDLSFIRNLYLGDFNTLDIPNMYDAIWCSHILEHQVNVNQFLVRVRGLLKEGGYLAIVVPPRKPFVVGGHVTLWNAGILLYNLVLAGFDCSQDCHIIQYDYNIGIIVKKREITNMPELTMDKGDIELLSKFFPFEVSHNFNGDIMEFDFI